MEENAYASMKDQFQSHAGKYPSAIEEEPECVEFDFPELEVEMQSEQKPATAQSFMEKPPAALDSAQSKPRSRQTWVKQSP